MKDAKLLVDAGNCRVQSRAGQRQQRARSARRRAWTLLVRHVTSSTGRTCFRRTEGRNERKGCGAHREKSRLFRAAFRFARVLKGYSRRNFLKAAGSGIVLTAVTGETLLAAPTPLPAVSGPFSTEKASFIVNGKTYAAEYEARTTLWEVIAMKLGLTGTNRSCNRASCGACSVLVDGVPFYSCHTLATEAAGKKILTIEGVGDEKNLHPLQRIGHTRVAADCGFCTAGWVVTAKGLLDKNPDPNGTR